MPGSAQSPSPQNLEMIARSAGPLRRIVARAPTYLADLRENPAWLAMFVLAQKYIVAGLTAGAIKG